MSTTPRRAIRSAAALLSLLPVFAVETAATQDAPGVRPVVHGTVRDSAGRPMPGAEVYVGVRRVPQPDKPGACEDFHVGTRLLALARTEAGARGTYRQQLPEVVAGPAPNCLMLFADVPADSAPSTRPVSAQSEVVVRPLPHGAVRVDPVLRAVPAEPGDAPRTVDEEWAEVAQHRVPGWAGLFVEGCTLVVNLTDPEAQAEAARAFAEPILRDRGANAGCPRPSPVRFRRVRYDFAQLARWYARTNVLQSLEGWTSGDIDEVRNRVELGFADSAAVRRAQRALAELDVPTGAVDIQLQPPIGWPGEAPGASPDPQVGIPLAPRHSVVAPAWSADGREIFFTGPEGMGTTRFVVRAVDAATRRVRTVGSLEGWNTGRTELRPAADGEALYVALTPPEGGPPDAVYRMPSRGGSAERVQGGLARPAFAVSPDGRRIAYVRAAPSGAEPDSLRIAAVAGTDGTSIDRGWLAFGAPFAFSSDGDALVYVLNDPTRPPERVEAKWYQDGRGAPRVLWSAPLPAAERPVGVRWVGGSPRLLVVASGGGTTELLVVDGATGRRTRLGTLPAGEGPPGTAAWSRDGKQAAVWVPVEAVACTEADACAGRRVLRSRLYLWREGTDRPTALAEVPGAGGPWLAFSPDGRRLAYLAGGLYVERLP